jgi:YesN/AraC family two-component response regulator
MPIMNGLEMSSEILKKNSMQAIIITTAHNEIEFLSKAINIGISGFITKPINNTQFINTLHRVSLAISDRKFVEAHVYQMEEITIELEQKCKEYKKSIHILDTITNKKQMIQPQKEIFSQEEIKRVDDIKEQISYLINDDLYELIELHSEIDNLIIEILSSITNIQINNIYQLASRFSKYSSILSHYSFFSELSIEMSNLSHILKTEKLPVDITTVENIFMLLESFIFVLGRWQKDLLSGEENKINAFDASIVSDMKTITNMWSQKEEDLQDIFDF